MWPSKTSRSTPRGRSRHCWASLDDRFLVLNGDVTLDASLSDFIAHAPSVGAALVLVPVADPSAYGVVVLDDDGFVERFVEKPAPGLAPANTVSAGVYLVERRALEGFEQGPLSFERRVFPDLAAHKELGGVVLDGLWLDIGTPALYLNTHEMLLSNGSRLYEADGRHGVGVGAVVDGECHGSWSWIGAGATVEHGASIKESVILPGARIESGARDHAQRRWMGRRRIRRRLGIRGDIGWSQGSHRRGL